MAPDADPLTAAELDALDALNRARTPGRLCVAVSARGEFGIFGGADGEEWIATFPRGRGAEAEAFVAMANALPALLAEVRASMAAAVEVASIAAVLQAQGPCLACRVEGEEETCVCHESRELGAALVTVMGAKGASK